MYNSTQKVKAVFFDMDGTVLDTEPIHTLAFAEAFKRRGVKDEVDFLQRCIGLNIAEMRKLYTAEIGAGEDFDALDELAWEIAGRLKIEQGIKAKPGFFELIEFLASINAKSYIVTSTLRKIALHDLELAGALGYFTDFVCYEDYEKGKPDPLPYLTALKLSGFNADECFAIEDSWAGLTSATGAGLRCVLIRDMAKIPEETAKLAWADVETLADVIDLI